MHLGLGLGFNPAAPNTLIVNITPPKITGIPVAGQSIGYTPGIYTGSPTITYKLYKNGVASAVTSAPYVATLADEGVALTWVETATNTSGTATGTSSALTIVPNSYANYDPSDLSTITQVGGAVSQLNDKTGNGNHATQSTGAQQPMTGVDTINGLNVISYTTAGQLILPGSSRTLTAAPFTFIIVGSMTDGTQTNVFFGMNNGGSLREILQSKSSQLGFSSASSASTGAVATRTADNNPHIIAGRRSATNIEVTQDGSGGMSVGTDSADWTGTANAALGKLAYTGKQAQVIIFSRQLSNAEVNSLCQAIGLRLGITWTHL